MLKKSKKIIAILLVAILLFNADMAMAVTFTDVNKTDVNSWAYDYIIELANKNIINGYEDGSYKPASNVRYLEVLKLIDGIVDPTASERTDAKLKYGTTVTELGISDWAKPAVELALYRNIATETELKNAKNAGYLSDTATKYIDRKTISIFMAKALELSPKSNPNLSYKDKDQLSSDEAKLIAALIDTGVLHKDGRDGSFEGKAAVKRSEVAKMFKFAYDWVAKNPLTGNKTENVKAEIIYYLPQGDVKNLAYKEEGKKQEIVKLDSSTKIYDKSGKELNFVDLEKLTGAIINLEYKVSGTDKLAVSIKVVTDANVKSGDVYLYQAYKKISDKSFDLTITDLDGKNSRTVESIFDYAMENGKEVKLSDLKRDTRIKLEYLDGKVVRIVIAEPAYEIVDYSTTDLKVKNLSKDKDESFFLSTNVKVTREGKEIYVRDIRKGDRADLTFDGSYVSQIDIYSSSNASSNSGMYKLVSYYPKTRNEKAYVIVDNNKKMEIADNVTDFYDGYRYRPLEDLNPNSSYNSKSNYYIDVELDKYGYITRITVAKNAWTTNSEYFTRDGREISMRSKKYTLVYLSDVYLDGKYLNFYTYNEIPEFGYARIDSDSENNIIRIDIETNRSANYYEGRVTNVSYDLKYNESEITVSYYNTSLKKYEKDSITLNGGYFRENDAVKVYLDSWGRIIDLDRL